MPPNKTNHHPPPHHTPLLTLLLTLLLTTTPAHTQPPTQPQQQPYTDHIIIILDASGSMKQKMRGQQTTKINAAKNALKTVLQNTPPTTHIGLLVFSANNLQNHWAYPLGPHNQQQLTAAIDHPQPHGGTPLGKYIKIAADQLLQTRQTKHGYGTYRLLIVTDGDANDLNLLEQYTPEIITRGITIDVIGVDMQHNHTLAHTAHTYRRADNPQTLQQAIQQTLAELNPNNQTTNNPDTPNPFQLITPLPTQTAAAIIQTLTTTPNHPIGQTPTTTNQPTQPTTQTTPTPNQPQQPQPQTQPTQPTQPTNQPITRYILLGTLATLLLLLILKNTKK